MSGGGGGGGGIHPGLLHEILDYLGTDDLMKMIKGGENMDCVSREATEILENRFETENEEWRAWAARRGMIVYGMDLSVAGFSNNLRQLFLAESGFSHVTTLRSLSELVLDFCGLKNFHGITDLEGLENVVHVQLENCSNVTVVSHLKNARRLVVCECPGVIGYYTLEKLTDLRINFSNSDDPVFIRMIVNEIYSMNLTVLSLYSPRNFSTCDIDLSQLNVSDELILWGFFMTGCVNIKKISLDYVNFYGDVRVMGEDVFVGIPWSYGPRLHLLGYNTTFTNYIVGINPDVKIDATNLKLGFIEKQYVNGTVQGNRSINISAGNMVAEVSSANELVGLIEIERIYGTLKFIKCVGTYTHDRNVIAHVDATESPGLDVVVAGGIAERVQDVVDVWTIRRAIPIFGKHIAPGIGMGIICGSVLISRGYRPWTAALAVMSIHTCWSAYKYRSVSNEFNQMDEIRSQGHKPMSNMKMYAVGTIAGLTVTASVYIGVKLLDAGVRFLLRR